MMGQFNITNLRIECSADGNSRVALWLNCYSTEDIDDVIAWLELAKTLLVGWEDIRRDAERPGS